MLQRVITTIEKYKMIDKNDGIVVGVSGGPDSLALLHVLRRLKDDYNLKIFAAHVNHNLRGQESDEDQRFVEMTCKEWDIPLFIESSNIEMYSLENKISLEEAGREVRYGFFRSTCGKTGAKKIAVAHNLNDNAETILMRILRGSGIEGLSGIKPVRENIIRPLIEIGREEIEEYCRENKLSPRIDSSNLKKIYTRNKVRLELIPYLKKEFNENIIETVNRLGKLANEDVNFIGEYTQSLLEEVIIKKSEEYIIINLEKLNEQHEAVKRRVIRGLIEKLQGNLTGIEYVNIEEALNFISCAKTGSMLDMPKGIKLRKSYNELEFAKGGQKVESKKYSYYMKIPGKIIISEKNSTLEVSLISKNDEIKLDKYTQTFDLDKVKGQIQVRNRQDGDIFSPKGMKGTKKLKDFFMDQKVPRDERDNIPLIAVGSEIIWIVGYRTSEKYKVDENTQKLMLIRYLT